MKTLVVYYSRTGTTRILAEALASSLDADLREIGCKRYRPGILRYLRAGYDSVRRNRPPIEMPSDIGTGYDLVLIGTPVWTSRAALPVRVFLEQAPAFDAPIGLFMTHGGHSPADQAISEIETLVGRKAAATLVMNENDMSESRVADGVKAFVEKLTASTEA